MILSIFGKTLTAPRRKLAALPQKPAARPRRFLTPPRRLAPARHWARRVYRIFYALYGQWRASMCPTGALDCSVRGIPAMAAPNAYTLANERTARARWRSRSLPPGGRALGRGTCPVPPTRLPPGARSLARNACPVSPPRPPPLPPLGGGARKTPRAAALLTLRGLSGVWVRVYFNQFAFFVKLYIFVHLGISPIVIPRASCKGARSLPVRASSKLRAQTNQNQLHGRGCAPNSPRVWGAAGAVPRSFVA